MTVEQLARTLMEQGATVSYYKMPPEPWVARHPAAAAFIAMGVVIWAAIGITFLVAANDPQRTDWPPAHPAESDHVDLDPFR